LIGGKMSEEENKLEELKKLISLVSNEEINVTEVQTSRI
jgi:hypothetical protein